MRRNANFARGSHVPSAVLDAMQDEQVGIIPATDAPATLLRGADGRWWTTPDAGLADGTLRVIDTSLDWRYRKLWGRFRSLGAANRRPGQVSDHLGNDPASTVSSRDFEGWTGAGGHGAASAVIADGTPPVLEDDCYAVVVDEGATSSDRVYLFARPSDGALCVYNDSGATLHAELRVYGSGASPSLGASPTIPGRLTSAPGFGTTDDTWTTAITITPTGSNMLALDVVASAVRSDGARGGAWRFHAAFRTPASSTPVQVGDTIFVLAAADDLSGGAPVWKVRAHVSGADVLIQVRGDLATNIKWRVETTVTEARA